MSSMVTSIVMDLVDRVTGPARRIQQTLSGLGRKAGLDRLANSARQVGATVGTSIERIRSLTQSMAIMGGVAAGAVWGVERLVSGVADVGIAVQRSAERLSVGTTWLQEWQYVGKQFGVANDALVDGLKELSLRADEFIMTAGGPAAEAFGRLGIGAEELRKTGGRTEALFDLVRERLRGIQNDAARQRIFDEIFGGQGGEQMVAMLGATREEMEAMIRQGRESGAFLSEEEIEQSREYTRQMGTLRQSLFGIQATVVGELLPAITDWIGRMRELATVNREVISDRILEGLRGFWEGLKTVGRIVSSVAGMVGGFGNLALWIAGVLSVSLLGSLAAATLAIINLGSVLLLTPLGWFLGAIALIAGAAYLIYRNWDGIVAWFGDLWGGIKAFFDQGIGDIARGLLAFSPAALLLKGIDAVFELFGARPLSEMGKEWIGGLAQGIIGMWDGIQAFFSQSISEIARDLLAFSPAALLLKGIDAVFELFGARPLSEMGKEWIGGLAGGISQRWDQLTGWLSSKMHSLTDWLPDWARDGLGIEGVAMPRAATSPGGGLGKVQAGRPLAAALGPPITGDRSAALPAPARTDVSGELRIVIDSEGKPRVAEVRRNGALDFDVDAGMLGVMP